MSTLRKTVAGLALALFPAFPALAQDPSPTSCDEGETMVEGECQELEDIITVTGSRGGSSGGQSGLGGGTGSTSSGSSNNGYSGRPGGSAGNGRSQEQGHEYWQNRTHQIWDATYGQTGNVLREVICSPFSTVATTTVGITEGMTAVNHATQGRPHMARPAAGRAGMVAVLAGVLTEGCP